MSILRRLEPRVLTPQQVFNTGGVWEPPIHAGVRVTQDTALGLSAVWACIRLLTNSVATLPVDAFRRENGARVPVRPRPEWLDTPNDRDPSFTRVEHFSQVVLSMLTDGNAFIRAVPSILDPRILVVLDPRGVQIRRDNPYPTYRVPGLPDLTPLDMIHVPLIRRPGEDRGMNPIEAFRQGLGLALAAEEFGARFYGSGATMTGLIELPAGVDMTDDQAQALAASLQRKHGGVKKSHAVGTLTGGATFKQLTINQKDAQFIELRKYQTEEIARLFGVPPHMIASQEPGAVAYASVEQQAIQFVTYGLRPILERIEAAYQRLVPDADTFIKFNVAGLLRGDMKSRYEAYQIALQNKMQKRDEVRALEDLPPFGGADGGFLETPNNNPPPTRGQDQ